MPTRRDVLAGGGTVAAGAFAGCVQVGSSRGQQSEGGQSGGQDDPAGGTTTVYQETLPSVVGVLVYGRSGPASQGSGFVGPDGSVLTNEHVVANASDVKLRFDDNEWRDATVSGTDPYSDLAVLEPNGTPSEATPLSFVDTDPEPPVGTPVLAIGSPYGFTGSASEGIVSGIDRLLPAPNDFQIADAVQTDAALNPGNSGGPLVTFEGDVVGVVSSAGGENVGFAISAALAKRVVPALAEDGSYDHPFMGTSLLEVTPAVAETYGLENVGGVVVADVLPDGPAQGVLRPAGDTTVTNGVSVPTGGDVVRGMGGTEVETMADLSNVLALDTSPGDTIPVTVIRDGAETTVDLTLGARPDP
ncbi:trypsin-like peptidase domain-containing protein [Halorarum halophilum]|uniref:Trypsin-like peptidase domain-containing protein n=1 Tax=Halorarum halophilum TaxID=2743090 RepID=A0A7D5GE04_9EURY|nr:trypsin-like peptidase domain-containing protein [Halobaculum halophilum]QLG27048.1 trypsin-like peptidase domain-containing protein [Halobaculum halophilum]